MSQLVLFILLTHNTHHHHHRHEICCQEYKQPFLKQLVPHLQQLSTAPAHDLTPPPRLRRTRSAVPESPRSPRGASTEMPSPEFLKTHSIPQSPNRHASLSLSKLTTVPSPDGSSTPAPFATPYTAITTSANTPTPRVLDCSEHQGIKMGMVDGLVTGMMGTGCCFFYPYPHP